MDVMIWLLYMIVFSFLVSVIFSIILIECEPIIKFFVIFIGLPIAITMATYYPNLQV